VLYLDDQKSTARLNGHHVRRLWRSSPSLSKNKKTQRAWNHVKQKYTREKHARRRQKWSSNPRYHQKRNLSNRRSNYWPDPIAWPTATYLRLYRRASYRPSRDIVVALEWQSPVLNRRSIASTERRQKTPTREKLRPRVAARDHLFAIHVISGRVFAVHDFRSVCFHYMYCIYTWEGLGLVIN